MMVGVLQAFESKTMTELAELSERDDVALTTWTIWRRKIYVFMEEPMSSTYAQVMLTVVVIPYFFPIYTIFSIPPHSALVLNRGATGTCFCIHRRQLLCVISVTHSSTSVDFYQYFGNYVTTNMLCTALVEMV